MANASKQGRPSNDSEKEDLDILEFFEEYGPNHLLKMYRIEGGRQRWVCSLDSVASMPEEEILEKFGPGRYLIRAKGKGNNKWVASQVFEIEGPNPSGQAIQIAPNQDASLMDKLMLMQAEHANKTHDILIALISNMGKGGSSFDPAALMGAMFTGVTAINQLTPKSASTGMDLDGITKIMDIAERFNGNGGGAKGTLETVIDAASKILPSILEARMLNAAPSEAEAITNQPVQIPAQSKTEDIDLRIQLQRDIKILWERLTKAAQKTMDPEGLVASLMDLEELDDLAAGAIIQSAYQAATFEEWQKQTGAIADNIRPWFELFYKAVKELTREGGTDVATSDDTPGQSGNTGHSKAD